jgi:ADP-ribose pyrophosphatase
LLELPAGKLERGEAPRPAAVRELGEEVGLEPVELIDLGYMHVSPGFCNERIYLYLAQELKTVPVHPDEDEFLDIVHLPFGELVELVMSGEITDAKTVAAVLKIKVLLNL